MKKQAIFSYVLLTLLATALPGCKKSGPDPESPRITSVSPLSGNVGDRVTITGERFSPNMAENQISFGTVFATIDSATSTQLYTRVPRDANRCRIVVNVNGLRGESAEYFQVHHILPEFKSGEGSINELDNLRSNFVRVTSTLSVVGSQRVLQHGHVWSHGGALPYLEQNTKGPEDQSKSELGSINWHSKDPYSFVSYIDKLKPGTTYRIRAYVTTTQGTFYGPLSEFTTLNVSNQ